MNRIRRRLYAMTAGAALVLIVACSGIQAPQQSTSPQEPVERQAPAAPQPRQEAAARAVESAPRVTTADGAEASVEGVTGEEVVVTGTRIRRDHLTAPAGASGSSANMTKQAQASAAPPAPLSNVGAETFEFGRRILSLNDEPSRLVTGTTQPGEEIWIIAMPANDEASSAPADDLPATGTLVASLPHPDLAPQEIPLPLKHTDVRAEIAGYVGIVDVKQQFENPYDEKIEAVYMFPLPEKAAVREFVMTIGERRIRGILREKAEAEQIYHDARAQGYQASLIVQHRPNMFEQKVANIEPGKQIDVDIRYFHTLAYHDGWYTWTFPTVVGPRYNPAGTADPVAARPRGEFTNGTSVQYLRPNERSAHDINLEIDIDAGVRIEELYSTHTIVTTRGDEHTAHIRLADGATLPNRDFVLHFKVAGSTIKSNLLTYVDPETGEGYFTLMVYPPADLQRLERQPVEMVFVIDTSGSMSGRPMDQAKSAMLTALDRLEPRDTFQIIRFSNSTSSFGAEPVPATEDNVRRAKQYVAQLTANGGTEMLSGLRASLNFPHDEQRLRFVTFMTDGYIGNDAEVIGEVSRLIGEARIFSFGVGNSVNRYLLERIASEGRGAVAYLGLEDSARDIMTFFFNRISHPAMTDVDIDWGRMKARDVYPARMPDLFVGRPVFLTGRFDGEPGSMAVRGRAGNVRTSFAIDAAESAPSRDFIASLWARQRIADLMDRRNYTPDPYDELAQAIRDTALGYGLMSDYTAFVAVDATERTSGAHGTTVYQAVPVPDGVRYETTVGAP